MRRGTLDPFGAQPWLAVRAQGRWQASRVPYGRRRWQPADGSVPFPDAAFVRKERWFALTPKEREGVPHFGPRCRIRGSFPEPKRGGASGKAVLYLKNGVGLVALLDPYAHRVEVFRKEGATSYQDQEAVVLEPGPPGFQLLTRGPFL